MKMLKADGRIVYSTCSMNPVENEAVIAAALKSNPDFELVDVSARLPELRRRPGISSWRPTISKSINTSFETYDDYIKSLPDGDPGFADTKLSRGHWPPSDAAQLGLERCIRIYPHLQDTGAFFVAVLQRTHSEATSGDDPMVGRSIERKREADDITQADSAKRLKLGIDESESECLTEVDFSIPANEVNKANASKGKSRTSVKSSEPDSSFKEQPYTYVAEDDPVLRSCIQSLNLTSEFPLRNVLVRNPDGEPLRTMYLTNDVVKRIVKNNDYTRIRLVTCGTKVFTKQEGGKKVGAHFRVLGEGLPVILPYTDPKSVLDADIPALKIFLTDYYPLCTIFGGDFKTEIEKRAPGNHVVRFPPGEWDGATITHDLFLPIWKSNVSVSLMIDKKAKSAISLRLFGKDITTIGRDVMKDGQGEADTWAEEPQVGDDSTFTAETEDLLD